MKNAKSIKQNYIRENNVKVIIDLLNNKAYSCLEIAKEIKISDVGANKIIKKLLTLNMIKRVEPEETKKKIGGQHIRYTLNTNTGVYVCVDLTEYVDVAYIHDFSGKIIDTFKFNISRYPLKEELLDEIERLKIKITEVIKDYNDTILGIGISVPGQVEKNTNKFIGSDKFKNLEKEALYEMFQNAFDTHIIIRHNVQLMAIGESYKGKLISKYDVATYVYLGMGIAACVLFRGENVSGWRGYAGEIGDNKIYPSSTLYGYGSLVGMLHNAKKIYPEISLDDLFELYNSDAKIHSLINESAVAIAMFMNNVTNLLGCNLFMVSGMALNFGDEFLNVIKKYLNKNSLMKIDVIKSSLENPTVDGIIKLLKDSTTVDYYMKKSKELLK